MRICFFAFGKLKTPGLRDAADYYLRMSRSWASCEEIELKPLSIPDKAPETRKQIQEKEGRILLEEIKSKTRGRTRILLLDELGTSKPSEQWAKGFRDWEMDGIASVCFCIGSSLGFSVEVRNRADGLIAFGSQTLPHELARVVLYEQIFRAFSIMKGHPYHNAGT